MAKTDAFEGILEQLGRRGVAEAFERLGDSKFGRSDAGSAALSAVEHFVSEHGLDGLAWLVDKIQARQQGRIDSMVESAKARNDARRDEALDRLRRDQGEGHQ